MVAKRNVPPDDWSKVTCNVACKMLRGVSQWLGFCRIITSRRGMSGLRSWRVRSDSRGPGSGFGSGFAFTLIELLVVIALIAVLASLLLPALSAAKDRARSVTCKNRLHQISLALQMYVNEYQSRYPYYWTSGTDPLLEGTIGRDNSRCWWAKLIPYYPVKWTNATYHCPGYKGAINGCIITQGASGQQNAPFGSYAYNSEGVAVPGVPGVPFTADLGLGPPQAQATGTGLLRGAGTPEPRIKVPSEMLAIGESRFLNAKVNGTAGGSDRLTCGLLKSSNPWHSFAWYAFDPARHGRSGADRQNRKSYRFCYEIPAGFHYDVTDDSGKPFKIEIDGRLHTLTHCNVTPWGVVRRG